MVKYPNPPLTSSQTVTTVPDKSISVKDCDGTVYDFVRPWHLRQVPTPDFVTTNRRKNTADIYRTENYYVTKPKEIQVHEQFVDTHEERRLRLLNQDKSNREQYFKWIAANQRSTFNNTRDVNTANNTSLHNLRRSKSAGKSATATSFFNMNEYEQERDRSIVNNKDRLPKMDLQTWNWPTTQASQSSNYGTSTRANTAYGGGTSRGSNLRSHLSSGPTTSGQGGLESRPCTVGSEGMGGLGSSSLHTVYEQASPQASPRTTHTLTAEIKDLELFETRLQIIKNCPLEERLRSQLESMRAKQNRPHSVPLRRRMVDAQIVNPRPQTSTHLRPKPRSPACQSGKVLPAAAQR